jgi:hypothetical protein
MTQNTLSKNNLWCQELFQGTHLFKIVELFFGNCQRSAKVKAVVAITRKLLRTIFAMVRNHTMYMENYEQRHHEKLAA